MAMKLEKKRGRVESLCDSAHNSNGLDEFGGPTAALHRWRLQTGPHKRSIARSTSLPNIHIQMEQLSEPIVFADINVRSLRLAEVRSWRCAWMLPQKTDQAYTKLPPIPVSSTTPVTTTTNSVPPLPPSAPTTFSTPTAPTVAPNTSNTIPITYNIVANTTTTKPTSVPKSIDEQQLDDIILNIQSEMNDDVIPGAIQRDSKFIINSATTAIRTLVPPLTFATNSSSYSTTTSTSRTATNNTFATEYNMPQKRPQLKLKLDCMPTVQQAEDRAQRAANHLIAKREAIEKEISEEQNVGTGNSSDNTTTIGAAQRTLLKLKLRTCSSGDELDLSSPTDNRHSINSAYSPNHGMFTTTNVSVSEAGIASPDANYLNLQDHLVRIREIGRGASGIVYKAIHIPTLKVVAIKDVPVYGKGQRRQMVRELHALYANLVPISNEYSSKVQHGQDKKPIKPNPYIVSFYDAYVDKSKNCICMVMEYMGFGSLQDLVARGGCTVEPILSHIASQILHGLASIHEKLMVHRDVKPHNLLLNHDGEVKISDFGLARTLNDKVTNTKTFVGTLLYMAPERIGGGDYAYPADIWSFGLVLISVALGKYPLPTQDGFFGLVDSVANEKYLKLPGTFSMECQHFIDQCLIIDPNERPTAKQLLSHPFLLKYAPEHTFKEWKNFIEIDNESRLKELDDIADTVYRHLYERTMKFSVPQSDYGMSLISTQVKLTHHNISLEPVERSLQLGLSKQLEIPAFQVYEVFDMKRKYYANKLVEEYCFSPQSWTASPGESRRLQLFGSDSDSPSHINRNSVVNASAGPSNSAPRRNSFWKRLHESVKKFGQKIKTPTSSKSSNMSRPSYT